MRTPIEAGSTGNTIYLFAFDTSTKLPRVDLLHNTAGLQITYTRTGDTSFAISLALQTVNGAWTSGGFVRTNATDGIYRLDVPNAAVLAGVKQVVIAGSGVANVMFIPFTLDLVNYNPAAAASDEVDVVKIGGATIAGGAKMPSQVKGIDNNMITAASMNADASAEIADAVWDEPVAGHAGLATFGESVNGITVIINTYVPGMATAVRNAIYNWEPITGLSMWKLWRFLARVFTSETSGRDAATPATEETYLDPVDSEPVSITYDADRNRTTVDLSSLSDGA